MDDRLTSFAASTRRKLSLIVRILHKLATFVESFRNLVMGYRKSKKKYGNRFVLYIFSRNQA